MTPTASKTPITLYTPYILVWKMHTFLQKLQKLDSHSKQRQPIAASHNRGVPCWNSFPGRHFGFNGWISMLKSILGSLCREYHYVFLLRISSKLQSLHGCRWLGCSTQLLPGFIFFFSLSDSWVSDYCLALWGHRRDDKQDVVAPGVAAPPPLSQLNLSSLYPPKSNTFT